MSAGRKKKKKRGRKKEHRAHPACSLNTSEFATAIYSTVCWEGCSYTSHYGTKWKKKQEKPIEKVGRGLFSFRALSDMTASMKRLWLEDNVAYRYQPDWQWSWRRLSCYLSSCLSLIRGVKLSQRRLALRHRLHLFPLLQLSACRALPLVSFCFSLHFSLRSSLPSGRSLIQAPHPAAPHPLAPALTRSSLPLVFISPSMFLCSSFSFPGRGSRARLVLMNPCRPPENPHSDFLKWLWQGLKGALGFAKDAFNKNVRWKD